MRGSRNNTAADTRQTHEHHSGTPANEASAGPALIIRVQHVAGHRPQNKFQTPGNPEDDKLTPQGMEDIKFY